VRYHGYGQYDDDIRQVATAAMDYLQKRAGDGKKSEKLAAVFDIDETALSNWNEMNACGFCDYRTQGKYYPSVNDPAIVPVLELFRLAQKLGVKTFFITGRSEQQRDSTVQNLKSAGYDKWEQLIMRPANNSDPARIFKPAQRQAIVDSGYTIVLNIGDQASDLAGCCAERTFKLPNPFYLVP
jgi:acid phosphatase